MKKFLISALFLFPSAALAGHMDVLEFTLDENCSLQDYLVIVEDFNDWGETVGYHAEIAVPIQGDDLSVIYWLGTSANAAAFGNAWDVWRDSLADEDSEPAKLNARFTDCGEIGARWGYDIY